MDSMKCLLTLFLLSVASYVEVTQAKNGFIFTMPRILRHGSRSEFCLTLHGPSQTSQPVTMSLINAENGKTEAKIESLYSVGEQRCNKFPVPKPGEYELLLYNETDILHDSVKVTVLGNKLITLVQTDKPMYKPGQKVKFRVLTLLSDLKPRVGKIRSIYISDPNDIRVKQYLDVETKGIASLEFQVAPEAKLGKWKIEVVVDKSDEKHKQISYGEFEVKEYVLPRFEVEITPPSYILANQEMIEGKVCAKYTYGKPVTGYLDLEACWGTSYRPRSSASCIHEVVEISGCYNFSVNATELKGDRYYHYFGSELQLTASVTEAGSGAIVNKTHSGPGDSFTPLQIAMDDYTHGFFKPGLPFYGKAIVTRPDGTPAAGELIKITAEDHKNNLRYSSNFTTDSTGVVVYALCSSFTENSTSIVIDAEAILYSEDDGSGQRGYRPYRSSSLYTPRGYKQIRQWFSPSLSYIQIPRMDSSHKCGERLTLSIPFTTRENTDIEFHYQVMARGRVIKTGQISFDQTTSYPGMDLVQPPAGICLQWEELPTPPPVPTTPGPDDVTEDPNEEEEEDDEKSEEDMDRAERPPVPPPMRVRGFNRHEEPYMGDFREPVVRSEFVSDTVSNFLLDLTVTPIMSPKFTLLVYHVMPDGEVVADSMQFEVTPCFDNEVKMEFNKTTVLPGENIDIKLEANPGSVCGVGIVDKSVNILGGQHQITPEQIFDKIEEFSSAQFGDTSISYRSDDEYCEERIKNSPEYPAEQEEFYWFFSSQYVDAIQAFKASGFMVLTNLDLETRPCGRQLPVFYASMVSGGKSWEPDEPMFLARSSPREVGLVSQKMDVKTQIRSKFPETWLWNLYEVGETGEAVIDETAPHTITSWVGNAMCLDQIKGFGISDMTSLTTFQPFFLSLHLPYAAVRGERLPILFTVYNYLEKCLHIQISLDLGENFKVHNSVEHKDPVCVCGGDSYTAKFYATPKEIGTLPVLAQAEIVPGLCGNSVDIDTQYIGLADAVKRQMLVKAEGVEQQYSHSLYLCSKDGKSLLENVILPLPDDGNMVKDSARGEVKLIGDIMGPALTNLDNLVRMPTGCGEQNMVGFVPNIFVLKYLTNIGQLTEEIQDNAVKYMEIGYQRELTYRHSDGSFSAFGENDLRGSVWLTAFVVKSFAQARPYIFIDQKDMDRSLRFLRQSQLETGCFRETGKVFSSYMMGGLGKSKDKEESLTALTAYVLIALLNANVNTSEPVIQSAVSCIIRDFQTEKDKMDTYTLALASYAMSLYEPSSRNGFEMLKLLDSKAQRDGSLKYWSRETAKPKAVNTWYYHAAPSAEVEMTAYALMAYLGFYGRQAIERSHDVAMWLSQQRNPYGGFTSTQDTVVGLNALSEFASLAYTKDGTNLQIAVSGKRMDESFSVSDKEQNTMLLQTVSIPTLPNELTIRTEGKGCALIQASVSYNKKPESLKGDEKPSFHLKVSPRKYQHDIDRCDRRTIVISVGTRGQQQYSNGMSLVTVKMVTSWTPIPESLTKLKSQFVSLGMKRFEHNEEEGILTFYFDEFSGRYKEFAIDVEQDRDLAVSAPKPAEVKVFQYYETDVSVVQSYGLKTICGTKEEIPHKQPELDPNLPFPVQVRVDLNRAAPGVSADDSDDVCPVCIPIKTSPKNFKEIVCNSAAAYKTVAGRKGAKPLKLLQDLRPKQKVKRLNIFSDYEMAAGCDCTVLDKPPKKVLILVREKVKDQMLKLDSTSMVALAHKGILREVRKIQKSCPLKNDDNS